MKHMLRLILLSGCLVAAQLAVAAPIILNEYNGVGSDKYLQIDTFEGSDKEDTFFGRIQGNGGNWFELVVVEDHLDLRGWTFDWQYYDTPLKNGNGTISLTTDSLWSNLRRGTIITFGEYNSTEPAKTVPLATDTSFNPAVNDWWIHVRSDSPQYFTTVGSVTDAGVTTPTAPGEFSVNNDDWQLTLRDAGNNVQFGPAGEPHLAMGGLNSNEIFKLEWPAGGASCLDWELLAADSEFYEDGTSSSLGAPNVWTEAEVPFVQDLSALRYVPPMGDGNGDGMVTTADYTIWANNFGATGPGGAGIGDYNGDGEVTTADYTVWANHFGEIAAMCGAEGGILAVPEPSSLALALCALGLVGCGWQRRRIRSVA